MFALSTWAGWSSKTGPCRHIFFGNSLQSALANGDTDVLTSEDTVGEKLRNRPRAFHAAGGPRAHKISNNLIV